MNLFLLVLLLLWCLFNRAPTCNSILEICDVEVLSLHGSGHRDHRHNPEVVVKVGRTRLAPRRTAVRTFLRCLGRRDGQGDCSGYGAFARIRGTCSTLVESRVPVGPCSDGRKNGSAATILAPYF